MEQKDHLQLTVIYIGIICSFPLSVNEGQGFRALIFPVVQSLRFSWSFVDPRFRLIGV